MDYKEKYEQALEVAKETYNKQPMYREWLGKMFHELAESEDEKVRKELIDFTIKANNGVTSILANNYDFNKWLAWLEKQGEQKPLTIDIKSMVDSYEQRLIKNGGVSNSPLVNMCVVAFQHGVENTLDELHLKQGEQILANSAKTCKDEQKHENICSGCINRKGCINCEDGNMKETLEQKPAWSEEDMKIALRTEYEKGRADAIAEMQKEWSEEDEEILQGIWDEILANKHNAKECEWKTYDKFLDWLKSLRPQNRWKPSDEQLDALTETVHNLWGSPETTLSGLLADLKKLKENSYESKNCTQNS